MCICSFEFNSFVQSFFPIFSFVQCHQWQRSCLLQTASQDVANTTWYWLAT